MSYLSFCNVSISSQLAADFVLHIKLQLAKIVSLYHIVVQGRLAICANWDLHHPSKKTKITTLLFVLLSSLLLKTFDDNSLKNTIGVMK